MRTKKIASTAIFTALVCVMTILVRIPIAGGGYVNFGDVFIFVTAMCLGPFAGAFAGGVGSCIADIIGYPIYAPFTLVVKALEGLICGVIGMIITRKRMNKWLQATIGVTGMALGALVMVMGYFFTDALLTGSFAGAIATLPFNAIQGVLSVVMAAIAVYVCRLRKISERFGFVKPPMSAVITHEPPKEGEQ